HFAAPEPEERQVLRREREAGAAGNREEKVQAVSDFQWPDPSTVRVWDLSPLSAEELPAPQAPIAGPILKIDDDGDSWVSKPFAGTDDMLVVIAPGDLDPEDVETFEFQFNRSLADISSLNPKEVALLKDLGPSVECSDSGVPGYPRDIAAEVDLIDADSRLVVTPLVTLPADHCFRLELNPQVLEVDDGTGQREQYWSTAPQRFEFATRRVPGEVVGSLDEAVFPFGGAQKALDMIKLGNLLLVSSTSGRILAIDTTDHSETGEFQVHSILNTTSGMLRHMATDGHNRVFYSGMVGNLWAIRGLRVEDVRRAEAACESQPEWAEEIPCFDGVPGSVRVAYTATSAMGMLGLASEWLAAGAMPFGTPFDFEVLTQDEIGRTLELEDFYKIYAGALLDNRSPDEEGIYTLEVPFKSTYQRAVDGELEPSQDPSTPPPLGVPEWREGVCEFEEAYDRYQRVTVDNLSTGQSWSFDVENEWPVAPGSGGDGTYVLEGLRARRGDQLRVRYNIRAVGYQAILGSGITLVDLNRFYRLPGAFQSAGSGQCGRRLGKFEGQQMRFPS
ncbi:MAG: hypothetical protein GY856_24020, partial [bacterium]|nr:hypothetical protein [bacterium]